MRISLLLVVCLALCSGLTRKPEAALTTAPDLGNYVWISDIHFDPYFPFKPYGGSERDLQKAQAVLAALSEKTSSGWQWRDHSTWGNILGGTRTQGHDYPWGKDSTYRLLSGILKRASSLEPDPDFVVITGDFLGHDFGVSYQQAAPSSLQSVADFQSFTAQTMKFIAASVSSSFPGVPVYAALGNNDAYCGDYNVRMDGSNSQFLTDTAETFLQYFLPNLSAAEQATFRQSFVQGGFYAVTPNKAPKNRIVVLNSVTLMPKYPKASRNGGFPPAASDCNALASLDPSEQLDFLEHEFEASGAENLLVAMHVSPGEDCHSFSGDWTESYLDRFVNLLFDPKTTAKTAGVLAAHTHMAEFKLIRQAGVAESFVLLGPSISPIHKNNPSFRVVTHDRNTLEIQDYQTHYLDLYEWKNAGYQGSPAWGLNSFSTSYPGHTELNGASLADIFLKMKISGGQDSHELTTYGNDYNTDAKSPSSIIKSWHKGMPCISTLGQ